MSNPKRVEVDRCSVCPFVEYRREADNLGCTLTRGTIEGWPEDPPDWCPLRGQDHLVTLRVT